MSLGFLTESALLPSKAKKISVDSSSLIDLKAVVYQKEQNLKRNGIETQGLRKRRGRPNSQPRKIAKEESSAVNPGIKERQAKDEAEYQRDRGKAKRAKDILARKAAIYEKMAKGELKDDDGDFLVNFTKKPIAPEDAASLHEDPEEHVVDEGAVDLPTAFGRDSNTCRDEKYCDAHQRGAQGLANNITTQGSSKAWAWSKGSGRSDTGEWQRRKKEGYNFDPEGEEGTASKESSESFGQARVLSQWEKTLNVKAKMHLQQIHQETKKNRTAAEERLKEKQRRRELLRQKQQNRFTK
mmetsp:Transcript_27471/g.36013  ORF Transcript_27471/g.36013 Transcript_27471/m.36013 type:complete len:297 (+) Transcript_27471:110-1000(+)